MKPGHRDCWVPTEKEAETIAGLYRMVGLDVDIHHHDADGIEFWLVCGRRRP